MLNIHNKQQSKQLSAQKSKNTCYRCQSNLRNMPCPKIFNHTDWYHD